MSLTEKSAAEFLRGQDALVRGDHKTALKALSVAISYQPTIEAYHCKAEANFLAGQLEAAIEDIQAAKKLIRSEADSALWQEELDQALNRFQGARNPVQGPPVAQVISVLIPSALEQSGELMTRIINCPDLSTNGETLIRKGFTAVCDIQLLPAEKSWIDAIIEMSEGDLDDTTVARIKGTRQFLHIEAPNQAYAQNIRDQIDLTTQLSETLEPLMRALDAPVTVLRCSNQVITYAVLRAACEEKALDTLIGVFVKLMNDGDCLFSVGMHQFGYPDVEIPLSLMTVDQAVETLIEFLQFIVINNLHSIEDRIEFETPSQGLVYALQREKEKRFAVEGEARFNQYGIWKFKSRV